MRLVLGHPLTILAGLALAVAALAWSPVSATAHARLAASDPANGAALAQMPAGITLRFTEPVAQGSARFSVSTTLADSPALATADIVVDDATVSLTIGQATPDPQTIAVGWRVVSGADGHETTGLLVFSVGTGIPPQVSDADTGDDPSWISVGLRTSTLLGLALVATAIATGWLGGGTLRRRPAIAGAALAMAGLGADVLHRDLLGRQAGQLLLLAAGLAMVSATVVALDRPTVAAAPWIGAVAAMVAAGHAAGDADRLLAMVVGTTHAALGLAWAGAIVAVACSLSRSDRPDGLRRLGKVALIGVAGLALAGIGLMAIRVGGPRSLGDVTYGRLVIAKLVLFATAIAAAAVNRLVLIPRWPDPRWTRLARPVLTVEAIILAGAITVAGALTNTPPADGPRAVPVATRAIPVPLTTTARDLTIGVTAAILGAEDDELRISVVDSAGRPITGIQRLIVATAVTRPGETTPASVSRLDAAAVADEPGVYTLRASSLAVRGMWTILITVRRAGLEDRTGSVDLDTTSWVFQPPRLVRDAWRWPRVPPAAPVLLVTAAVVLGIGFAGVRRSRTIEPLPAVIILTAILAIAAGFTVQAAQQIIPAPDGADAAPPDGELDLIDAADDYRTYCLACHGADGGGVDDTDPLHDHGSGTDLLDAGSRDRSDRDLFGLTSEGVSGTTMPAYNIALTEEERWALVAYLRSLQQNRPTSSPAP